VAKLPKQPQVVALTPNTLQDVFGTAITIATLMGKEEAAYTYLAGLQKRIDAIIDTLRLHKAPPKRVMLLEWLAPIYNCGHWIPYQVGYAGGIDMLSNPGGDSIVTSWEKIVRYNPEVLVMAPCGFTIQRSMEEIHLLTDKAEWTGLAAVQNKAVYIADYDLFTQPSAGTLTDGIELLAAMFNPHLFTAPQHLQHKFRSLFQNEAAHV
jgi:iron complex transport system substrate-binding protein